MEEVWKDVPEFEGLYQVSNLGRIKSLDKVVNGRNNKKVVKRGRILKQVDVGLGYLQVCLRKDLKNYSLYVHILEMKAFVPNPDNLPQINHKDENKQNNFIWVNKDGSVDLDKSNLEWCTAEYNSNYGTRNKRVLETKSKRTYSKPEFFMRKVLMYSLEGEFEKEFESITEATKYLGRYAGSTSNISRVCQGKLKTAYGHLWKYAL